MSTPISLALALVRAALGIVFLAHGWRHLTRREKTAAWAGSIGLRAPAVQAVAMSFGELAIGAGLLSGLLTSPAAGGAVALMAVAFWTVHRPAGFFVTARPVEGWEYVFVITLTAIALGGLGPGEWSLDHLLGWDDSLDGAVGMAIAAGGVLLAALHLAAFYRRPPPS